MIKKPHFEASKRIYSLSPNSRIPCGDETRDIKSLEHLKLYNDCERICSFHNPCSLCKNRKGSIKYELFLKAHIFGIP